MQLNEIAERKDLQQAINFLIEGDKELENIFLCEFLDSDKPVVYCINRFRKFIKFYGRGKEITKHILDDKIASFNYNGLLSDIEELFLEPIFDKEYYIKRFKKGVYDDLTGNDFINWQQTGMRHLALLSQPNRAYRVSLVGS